MEGAATRASRLTTRLCDVHVSGSQGSAVVCAVWRPSWPARCRCVSASNDILGTHASKNMVVFTEFDRPKGRRRGCYWPIVLKNSSAPARSGRLGVDCSGFLYRSRRARRGWSLHTVAGASQRAILRRFCAAAAIKNSSRAPLMPRSRSRSSFNMRFRWANSISTFFRCLCDCE